GRGTLKGVPDTTHGLGRDTLKGVLYTTHGLGRGTLKGVPDTAHQLVGDALQGVPIRKTSEDLHPPLVQVLQPRCCVEHFGLHHDRYANVRGDADFETRELSWSDADDRHRVGVDANRLSNDLCIAAKTALPVTVAQDDQRVAAWNA